MFWDNVADVYDIFANIINKKTHEGLRVKIAEEIQKRIKFWNVHAGQDCLVV